MTPYDARLKSAQATAELSSPVAVLPSSGRGPRPKCLEFHITTVCDQQCVFCSEWPLMKTYGKHPISYATIAKTLIRKRRDGCSFVTFTGGEPTVHPRFLDILKVAKRLEYHTSIITDASRLADKRFALAALPFINEISISIHGDCAQIHDPLAGSPGSFKRVMRALANIAAFKAGRLRSAPFIRTNMVLTKSNVDRSLKTAQLVASLGFVWQFNVSNVGPLGNAFRNYLSIAPRLRDIAPTVAPLCALSERTGMKVQFYRIPLCILGGREDLSDNAPRIKIRRAWLGASVGLVEETHNPEIAPRSIIAAPSKCAPCALKDHACPGMLKPYYDHYGDGELMPMKTGKA